MLRSIRATKASIPSRRNSPPGRVLRTGSIRSRTNVGRPSTPAGFGNWFRDQCDQANLHHCSAHGLRKATSVALARAGASPHEIQAVTGHRTLSEVKRYTDAVEREQLANAAIAKLKG